MEYKKIEFLIEKYFEGETSLAEEKVLKNYFSPGEVAPELQQFAPLFQFFENEKTAQVSSDFEKNLLSKLESTSSNSKTKIRPMYRWISAVAAVLLLLIASVSLYNGYEKTESKRGARMIVLDDAENAEEAFEKVKAALLLVSNKMNKGTDKAKSSLIKINSIDKIRMK